MKSYIWVLSGVEEELDARQQRLADLVHEKIRYYYSTLYRTQPRYRHPLSLARLMQLTKRNGYAVLSALRLLANTVPTGDTGEPPVFYTRVTSGRNATHRPYRIFLRGNS